MNSNSGRATTPAGELFSGPFKGFLYVLLVVAVAYGGATLGIVPSSLTDDDGGYAEMAHTFWKTGLPGWPSMQDIAGFAKDYWHVGRIASGVQGAVTHVLGVSVFNALLPSFLVGLATLAATFGLTFRLWGPNVALLATVLLSISGKFFLASHSARPDLLLTLFLLAGLWLAASAREEKAPRYLFLSGLVLGLSADVHLNGVALAPMPLVFWLVLGGRGIRGNVGKIVIYSTGVIVGVAYWGVSHYLPDPSLVHQQMGATIGTTSENIPLFSGGIWGSLKAEAGRYWNWFWGARGHRHLLEGVLFLAGSVWLAAMEGRAGRAVVAVEAGIFIVCMLVVRSKWGWYLIYSWPLFAMGVAKMVASIPSVKAARLLVGLAVIAYVGNLGLWHARSLKDVPIQARMNELREIVPGGSPVLADASLWFAFWDRDLTTNFYLSSRDRQLAAGGDRGKMFRSELERRQWKFIVATATGNLYFASSPGPTGAEAKVVGSDVGWQHSPALRKEIQDSFVVERQLPGNDNRTVVLRAR